MRHELVICVLFVNEPDEESTKHKETPKRAEEEELESALSFGVFR